MLRTETRHAETSLCYHCGERCTTEEIMIEEKTFCCEGCRMVFSILNEHSLCNYYSLNQHPGASQRVKVRKDKFAFLDDVAVETKLLHFKEGHQCRVRFYLPQIHCSSCLYLLENLPRIHVGVVSGVVNFGRKEIEIVFSDDRCSLRELVETLASIGYEPYISLSDIKQKKQGTSKSTVFRLGVAGFCFGNIMLTSFPEYLGIESADEALRDLFRWFNLALSLPVLLYSAYPFFDSSVKSLRHRFLNIDAPIALAITITFIRSVYEVLSGTGGGYFDSMTGIVFFMLAGRLLQDKTYEQLSFDRDYTSYFPVSVPVVKDGREIPTMLPAIKPGDTIAVHHGELVPADGILTRGTAFIDYSFVTGEAVPVLKNMGELLYAGGKQTGERLELLVIREVEQSYLTRLWNDAKKQPGDRDQGSFVHLVSRYFTIVLMTIALITGIYWQVTDPSRCWPAVTAIFIIACPCALLLSHTFTNGNIIRILGKKGLYLRDASVIEKIASIDHVVLDKTGTLTVAEMQDVSYSGKTLTAKMKKAVAALAVNSSHPLSRAIVDHLAGNERRQLIRVNDFYESVGAGIEGFVDGMLLKLGSAAYTRSEKIAYEGAAVYLAINGAPIGYFQFANHYRDDTDRLLKQLSLRFRLSVLTGDSAGERSRLRQLLDEQAVMLFDQRPDDKRDYVKGLQADGEKVMMVGDGLNDGAALRQSDVGIAVAEKANNFTPSSDAIIDAGKLSLLTKFIRLCKANKQIVVASFILSILYNIVGLYYAVQGDLSPLVAAILMPASSLSILFLTYGGSGFAAKRLKL
ncbi:heavy metal translocating P-type ATPase metal-binding domain-containing protein [Terrimonas sp. NA20]|uniref:Heavy metal translocating P-type ATPase metal-binding domain-containing protein n=1 Tax=Terrimonas ginsenosidimutans TaxID=2908004 RepID=A0ABS9KSM7_9BACT|nr:heavy metal translocating P-type ATPase metal-binding domain-containing protein [Terrimonas ginsenosidimutans]MCG2615338.1 heavy metal translocating P-type ATPase metal-binding domain-containing protein [Terrimonas ginsenosidimutans]